MGMRRDSKKINHTKSYRGQKFVESHYHPCPAGAWHIDEEDPYLRLIHLFIVSSYPASKHFYPFLPTLYIGISFHFTRFYFFLQLSYLLHLFFPHCFLAFHNSPLPLYIILQVFSVRKLNWFQYTKAREMLYTDPQQKKMIIIHAS